MANNTCVARRQAQAKDAKEYANDLEFKLELDPGMRTEIVSSFGKILGQVTLVNKSSTSKRIIEVQAVKVWLEGTMTTKFKGKNNLTQRHHVRFLPDVTTMNGDGKNLSPLTFDVIRRDDPIEKKQLVATDPPKIFPFELALNGEILPASFKTKFVRLDYRLVLHIQLKPSIQFGRSIVMETKGCHNLSMDPSLGLPIVIRKERKDNKFFSLFSTRSPVMCLVANLRVKKCGFLPGEHLAFVLEVTNVNCLVVTKLSVSLVQKIVYFVPKPGARTTTTMEVLDSEEYFCETNDHEIHWMDGRLLIPRDLMPSFSKKGKKIVEIHYFLRFTVDISGDDMGLKGETTIVIGKTREPLQLSTVEGTEGIEESCHLDKITKGPLVKTDDDGDQSKKIDPVDDDLPPPSYSTLSSSSRRSSVRTLPPPYQEIFGWDEDDDWGADDGDDTDD